MPFGGLLTAGLGSAFGGLAGLFGGGKQQKTATTQTTNQSGNFNTSTTPNLTPLQKALIGQFTGGASQLYNQSQNLQPYESSGLEQINQGSNAAGQAIAANIAGRGLTFSPAGTNAQTQNILSRTGQQAQFANSIPLLQRQLQQQSLQQLMQAFQVIPTGTSQTGSTSQSSTTTGNGAISGNPTAGLFSGLGAGTLGSLPLLTNYMNNNGSPIPNNSVPENQIATTSSNPSENIYNYGL